MRFYFSGSEAMRNGKLRDGIITACEHRLQSCHGDYVKGAISWMTRAVELGVAHEQTVMLDSGAFTAWSKGHIMTIDELLHVYTHILESFEDAFKEMWFINLDVIPGSRQKKPTEDDIVEALRISDINFSILTDELGDRILPVYHQGEKMSRLRELEAMSDYICISPRQTLSEKIRLGWLDTVAAVSRDDRLYHGLAQSHEHRKAFNLHVIQDAIRHVTPNTMSQSGLFE